MLRRLALAQSGQVHTRFPFSIAGDHDNGGGDDGVGRLQVEQLAAWNRSVMRSG